MLNSGNAFTFNRNVSNFRLYQPIWHKLEFQRIEHYFLVFIVFVLFCFFKYLRVTFFVGVIFFIQHQHFSSLQELFGLPMFETCSMNLVRISWLPLKFFSAHFKVQFFSPFQIFSVEKSLMQSLKHNSLNLL